MLCCIVSALDSCVKVNYFSKSQYLLKYMSHMHVFVHSRNCIKYLFVQNMFNIIFKDKLSLVKISMSLLRYV